jgi:hypothetical protein
MAAASRWEVVDSNLGRFLVRSDRYCGRDANKGKDDEETLGNEHALILRLVGPAAVLYWLPPGRPSCIRAEATDAPIRPVKRTRSHFCPASQAPASLQPCISCFATPATARPHVSLNSQLRTLPLRSWARRSSGPRQRSGFSSSRVNFAWNPRKHCSMQPYLPWKLSLLPQVSQPGVGSVRSSLLTG